MNLSAIVVLGFTTASAFGQQTSPRKPLPIDPTAFVQSLYTRVVARHPHGIPEDEDWKIFAPYFSKALLHRFDLAKACSTDWDRSNPDPALKAEMTSSYDIFSGERGAKPQSFQIQKTQPEKDGSSLVYVTLAVNGGPPERPYSWRVAPVVIREDGRSVVDDVIYLNDSDYRGTGEIKPPNKRLSGYLSAGCVGPRWIGYSLPNQPEALIRGLYEQVVTRAPLDIPRGEDWKVFAPYLSKTLMGRLNVYSACMADWDKQNPNTTDKPPGLIEFDIFSGSSEEGGPTGFHIENAEMDKDGAIRVYVRLRWQGGKDIEVWRVADVLKLEKGRLILDDVVFLKDPKQADDVDALLSTLLTDGCDGPHWVGYREH